MTTAPCKILSDIIANPCLPQVCQFQPGKMPSLDEDLVWLNTSNPYVVDIPCVFNPEDFYDSAEEEEPECYVHGPLPKYLAKAKKKDDDGDGFGKIPIIKNSLCTCETVEGDDPDCFIHGRLATKDRYRFLMGESIRLAPPPPPVTNSHNILPMNKPRPETNPPLAKSTGLVYQYIRDLGYREEYDRMVVLQIYKLLPVYPEIPACLEKHVVNWRRGLQLGFLVNIFPGRKVFLAYVVAGTIAHQLGLRFGDQLLEVDDFSVSHSRALDQLIVSVSSVLSLLIKPTPFLLRVRIVVILHTDCLGFTFRDGEIVYIADDTDSVERGLKVDHQIIEINRECVVGLTDAQLKRQIHNSAFNSKTHEVQLGIMPRKIYRRLTKRLPTNKIRNHALRLAGEKIVKIL